MAHGRLRDAQPFGRARDRALLHHRQQQLQQPAVEVGMIESLMERMSIGR
jgi:hypothetical protein